MAARGLALFVALALAVTGALPVVARYRCLPMRRTIAAHACCPQTTPSARLDVRCCEPLAAPALSARASVTAQPDLAAPSLIGVLDFAPWTPTLAIVGNARRAALPRGRPPGEQLDRLSPVLRV